MIEIDWEMVKANLDRLTNESLNEILELILTIRLNRAIEEQIKK